MRGNHIVYIFSMLLAVLITIAGCNRNTRTCNTTPLANDSTPPHSLEFRVTWSDPNQPNELGSISIIGSPATVPVPSGKGFFVIVSAWDNDGINKILLDYTQFNNDGTQFTNAVSEDYSCIEQERTYRRWFDGGNNRSFNFRADVFDFQNNKRSTATIRINEIP
ncbi:MAG: hypothetical protein OEU26_03495 [Candidatus Tectomicrobia bacterium]|nr:hypothetical protein [Candidatus Tectomicrobia bacterium]